jgi:hypothetical protein
VGKATLQWCKKASCFDTEVWRRPVHGEFLMTIVDPAHGGSSTLMQRVKGILLSPASEWSRIEVEPATIQGLYAGYVCILAAAAVLARLIGSLVFGYGLFGVVYRPTVIGAVVSAVVSYVLALVGVFILALVVEALAPTFGGQKNRVQAFKLAAYAGTAGWVAGLFGLYPPLSPLIVLGSLYGIYLLYLGVPILMKAPADKALGYTALTVVVAILISVVTSMAVASVGMGAMAAMGDRMGMAGMDGRLSGVVHLPGGTSLDVTKMQAAAKAMEAAANQVKAAEEGKPAPAGAVNVVPADAVKALMPADLPGGLDRNELSAGSQSVGGVATANARAVYAKGDSRVTLSVTDMAAAGALASLGGALNIQSSRETATGYEKIGKVDGRMTTEEFDRQAKSGKYTVVVADRFVVEAAGSGVDMDQLKSAVNSVGFDRLEGLAKTG